MSDKDECWEQSDSDEVNEDEDAHFELRGPTNAKRPRAVQEKSSARTLANQSRKLQQTHAAMRRLVRHMRESEQRRAEERVAEIVASEARLTESMRLQSEARIEMTYTSCTTFGKDIPMHPHMVMRYTEAAAAAAKAEAERGHCFYSNPPRTHAT
ncbi:hypothetical protein CYMTET_49195 [Cymbomonas tetramitiformis]|uniref:Uncharacterized protein n=1 Tax=Cymbomonas tetramitiformis TaxID=36881 RepID=A0AAE0BRT5_9CHLO|nr:hypothetical protein CYMTET_49195 [Cymbomonas tetramitiformis]